MWAWSADWDIRWMRWVCVRLSAIMGSVLLASMLILWGLILAFLLRLRIVLWLTQPRPHNATSAARTIFSMKHWMSAFLSSTANKLRSMLDVLSASLAILSTAGDSVKIRSQTANNMDHWAKISQVGISSRVSSALQDIRLLSIPLDSARLCLSIVQFLILLGHVLNADIEIGPFRIMAHVS